MTEREWPPVGNLRRVEYQLTMLAEGAVELEELKELQAYTASCEDRIAELQDEIEDAFRD